jgi:hypothetical protein
MKVGQTLIRDNIKYTIYKIDSFNRCFAEDEFQTSIICIPNLIRIK